MKRQIASPDAAGRRLDIQGMRGLAVIPGVIYHMTDRLPGAVIFIDMFFAVSGYLITGRLIHLAQTRSTAGYFREFYKFRVKRLFPASITTILVTTLVAWLVFVPSRAHHITHDAVSALLFFANIHFAVQGTDYMHRSQATSPLLPFWSLSMEEQFYVVWPVLILLVLAWSARRGRQRSALAWTSAAVLVVSFGYGSWFTHAHHVAAYYDTPSRAWDFAVGSLLAVYAMRDRLSHPADRAPTALATIAGGVRDLLNRHASVVSWAGGMLFILAIFVTPTGSGFPVPWGFMGVAGAALVIYAGIDQQPHNWLLGNRFSAWLGDLSYTIYLVHFPVIIFAESYLSADKPLMYAFDIVTTIGLSLLLRYFVEEPGRRGLRATRAWMRAGGHRPLINAIAVSATIAVVLFAVAPKASTAWTAPVDGGSTGGGGIPSPTPTAGPPGPEPVVSDFTDPHLVEPTATLKTGLQQALRLSSWPKLTNEGRIDNLQSYLAQCDAVDPLHPPCVATPAGGTDPAKIAVALGDSTMIAYWQMLRNALVPQGWTVVLVARHDCAAALLPAVDDSNSGCAAYHLAYQQVLDHWRPSLVLLTTSEREFAEVANHAAKGQSAVDYAKADYATGLTAAVDLAKTSAARVVILSAPPAVATERTPANCLVAGSSPSACAYTPDEWWFTLNGVERAVSAATGATYADLVPFFCVSLVCPGAVGDVVVHADTDHITPEYADMLAPSFGRWLQAAGVTS